MDCQRSAKCRGMTNSRTKWGFDKILCWTIIKYEVWAVWVYPKNHGISKLVVWRSQNPALQSQTPLFWRVPADSKGRSKSQKNSMYKSVIKLLATPEGSSEMSIHQGGPLTNPKPYNLPRKKRLNGSDKFKRNPGHRFNQTIPLHTLGFQTPCEEVFGPPKHT